MAETERDQGITLFWRIAEDLIEAGVAQKGTLMGFECLRAASDGAFLATTEHTSGHLVVKLTPERVKELVASGRGLPFAPAGRVFKAWVAVPGLDEKGWRALLGEAAGGEG